VNDEVEIETQQIATRLSIVSIRYEATTQGAD
jgi:hypothetical protein